MKKRAYRTVFISDIHLGTRWCKAELLVSFLGTIQCDKLFLVGDIIDGWKLRKRPVWPQSHNRVLGRIMKMSRQTEVLYVTGNHDEFMDEFAGYSFGGIAVCRKAGHKTADGRSFLVIHGDEYDVVVTCRRWLAFLGDNAYGAALYLNVLTGWVRSWLGLPYWSLSEYLKNKVKDAVKFISDFESTLLEIARESGCHGVICGHIHRPSIKCLDDVLYCNTGDWVESCSALVEHSDGTLAIVRWDGRRIIEDMCERPSLDGIPSRENTPCTEVLMPV